MRFEVIIGHLRGIVHLEGIQGQSTAEFLRLETLGISRVGSLIKAAYLINLPKSQLIEIQRPLSTS